MTHMDLTDKEATILGDILASYLSDLKTERVGTENREWRADLREQETICSDLLGLSGGQPLLH